MVQPIAKNKTHLSAITNSAAPGRTRPGRHSPHFSVRDHDARVLTIPELPFKTQKLQAKKRFAEAF
jgi:hypothetical protein